MGYALGGGDSCACCGVKGPIASRAACRAFQINEILVLILMNVDGRTSPESETIPVSEKAPFVRCGYTD
jgi:hypothetical protein